MDIRFVIGSLIALVAATPVLAAPLGTGFTYQGQLKENGAPKEGTAHLRFSLWDAGGSGSPPVGGSQIGASHLLANVPVANGLFTVLLNAGGQFGADAFNGQARWIQIEVCADPGCGTLTILSPRQPLTAAPFARTAAGLVLPYSDSAISGSDAVNITQTGTGDAAQFNIVNPANVGEAVEARTDGGGDAVQAINTGTGRAAYFQISNAANTADTIYATTNGAGSAIFSETTAASGATHGVYGRSASTSGRGVFGEATAATGTNYGVYGSADSPSGYGVRGISVDNAGVRGDGTGTTGVNYGLYGVSSSSGGRGVYASASAGTGTTYGVYGTSSSVNGTGVYGVSTSSVEGYGIGVHGVSYSDDNDLENGGVFGESFGTNGEGVVGRANVGPTAIGVFGISTSGLAGGFLGDVYVSGTLSKSGGSFKIDHPLDPANKYLLHSFVESPDMMNIYNGNAVTGPDGLAWVELPAYFEALNRDFRYQLTVVGQFAQAIVAEKVRGNRFAIRTDKPGVEVSWQVTGVRQDPWAEAHRIQVEPEKRPASCGKYLNPELYGQPDELGESRSMAAVRVAAAKAERLKQEQARAEPGGNGSSNE